MTVIQVASRVQRWFDGRAMLRRVGERHYVAMPDQAAPTRVDRVGPLW
jgi:hypothetical protein